MFVAPLVEGTKARPTMGRRGAADRSGAAKRKAQVEISKDGLLRRFNESYSDAWVKPLQLRQDIFGACTDQSLNNGRSSRISDALADLCAEKRLVVHASKPLYRLPGDTVPVRVCKGACGAFVGSYCARESL